MQAQRLEQLSPVGNSPGTFGAGVLTEPRRIPTQDGRCKNLAQNGKERGVLSGA
jgi:hypothetical protein